MNDLAAIHARDGALMGERNGVAVPLSYGNSAAEYKAVRRNILMTDYSHFGIAQINGESAYELLNLVVAGDVSSIRDEQAMYTLILDVDGKIVSDVYILCDDERFLLLSEWLTGNQLCQLMRDALAGREDQFEDIGEISSLNSEFGIVHLEGPYAWELLAELYGMDVVGLPFQEHMHIDDSILLRSGKHGEFSYKLIANREALASFWQQALDAGKKYDLRTGGLDYQKQVRLENPCWEPSVFSDFSHCPIELQTQWAVRYDKDDFIGKEALSAQLAQGVPQRAIGLFIGGADDKQITRGDAVYVGDQKIGTVIACGYSVDCEGYVGRVMLDIAHAYADLDFFEIQGAGGRVAVKTAAVPFMRNFSFLVNPSEHSYVDASRPKHLLEQLEWKKRDEEAAAKATEAAKAAQAAEAAKGNTGTDPSA